MYIRIRNLSTGKIENICRDVCESHKEWIHQQLGTANEIEMQRFLDCVSVDDWYDANGNHLGCDVNGLELHR